MQIKAEQVLADINAFLGSDSELQAFHLAKHGNYTAEPAAMRTESAQAKVDYKSIKRAIEGKLQVPQPKPTLLPLEDRTMSVRSPFFTRHVIQKQICGYLDSTKEYPRHYSPENPPVYFPISRVFAEQNFSDLTKAKIDYFGLLYLKQRYDIPIDADLSPVFELPGANGKAAVVVNQVYGYDVRNKDTLQMSPAKKLYSEMQLYKFADEAVEDMKIQYIKQDYQFPYQEFADSTSVCVDRQYIYESVPTLRHWSLINDYKTYNTDWVNEVIDKCKQRWEAYGLVGIYSNPLFFFDIDCFDLYIEDGEVLKNVVYKALFYRYHFASGELCFLLQQLYKLSGRTSSTVKGDALVYLALDMYFYGGSHITYQEELYSLIVPRAYELEVDTAEFYKYYQLQRAYEEEYQRKNEEFRVKVCSALAIYHFARFKHTQKQYKTRVEQAKRKAEETFYQVQSKFAEDIAPFYTRLETLSSNGQESLKKTVDVPLLDCGFWDEMRDQQVTQKFLIFIFVVDEFYAIFDYIGPRFQQDNWRAELSEHMLSLLIDPRVHLCVISPFNVEKKHTLMQNALDANLGKLGNAEDRLHYIKLDVDYDRRAFRELFGTPASYLFFMQLKNHALDLVKQMQRLIDKLQPDIAFYVLTVEYTLVQRLIDIAMATGLPLHYYCPEALTVSRINDVARSLIGGPLVQGNVVQDTKCVQQCISQQETEAPTWLLRPNVMISAPGQDLFFSQVGGIGIQHIIGGSQYVIFQNLNYDYFYEYFGCYCQPYHSESAIKAYLSYSYTTNAYEPQYFYKDLMARSYVNFGRTMSAGSLSVLDTDFYPSGIGAAKLKDFYMLIYNILRSFGFRGRFECGLLVFKQGTASSFEFNQLVPGYTHRYLSHVRQQLYLSYHNRISYKENQVLYASRLLEKRCLFILNLFNEYFAKEISSLKALKQNDVQITTFNGSALDIVISGDKDEQIIAATNDVLTTLQNKSGGEDRMRRLLGNLDFNSMHYLQSEIEKTGTSAFFVCAINTMLETK